MLKAIEEVWEKMPDLRLGQLLLGAVRSQQVSLSSDLFYVADEDLIEMLKEFGERV